MKKFLLSFNSKFPFKIFGFQHLLMTIVTIILFIIVYKLKDNDKLKTKKNIKKIRIIISIIILLNMFIYRGSYMYYGIYNVKIHLSLYYCHIVNYLFVLSLIMNYKPFYKIIYGLTWIGSFCSMIFPDISGGIDTFLFYSLFISHHLMLVFVTLIMGINKIHFKFKDLLKSSISGIGILLITYCINYDFGTNYNRPSSVLYSFGIRNEYIGFMILVIVGFIGGLVGLIINKIYVKKDVEYEKNI